MGNAISNENSEKNRTLTKVPKHLLPIKHKSTLKNQKKPDTTQSDVTPKTRKEKNCLLDQESSQSNLHFTWSHAQKPIDIKSTDYYLPNDQTEQDRHKFELYVLRWAFSTRHIVPPQIKAKLFDGIQVLDVNCGPGLWEGHPILDMAQDFVQSSFYLVDTSNLLPQYDSFDQSTESIEKYKNFTFTCHNVVQERTLPFETDAFDFVQQRIMSFVYKSQDWPVILQEFKRVTKPGGYVQLIEVDFPPHNLGPQGKRWIDQIDKVLNEKLGIDARFATQTVRLLSEAGFCDVQTRFVTVPIGSWGLDIGNLWKQNYESFFESAKFFLIELMEISSKDYKRNVDAMMDELDEYRPFSNVYHTWACCP